MKLILSILLCAFPLMLRAQTDSGFYSNSYKERNSGSFGRTHPLLSFAYGFPNQLAAENNSGVYKERKWFGPLIVRTEFPIRDEIGIAPQVSYYRCRFTDYVGGVDKASVFDIGAMGMYHFNKLIPVRKLDLYTGIGLRLLVANSQWNVGRLRSSNLVSGGTTVSAGFLAVVGARYYLASKFAVFAEGGFPGGSYADIGITFNLKK